MRALLGDGVVDVETRQDTLALTRFTDGAGSRDHVKARYGPVIAVHRAPGDDRDRVTALDAALAALGDAALDGSGVMRWEHLLLTATRG